MTGKNRQPIICGNWKMYKTNTEVDAYIAELIPLVAKATVGVYLAVPFTAISLAVEKSIGSNLVIGAQNMNDAAEGAFTGEIAARMLVEVGSRFVIVGHSERRRIFGETDAMINRKVLRALEEGLRPLLCVGETLPQREDGQTKEILENQLKGCLEGVTNEQMNQVIIAYEPVWAIGSGATATPEIAQEAHQFIRSFASATWGENTAQQIIIQYGGSVKADNAAALMSQPDIDGLLVGGASLSAEVFSQIVNYQNLPAGKTS